MDFDSGDKSPQCHSLHAYIPTGLHSQVLLVRSFAYREECITESLVELVTKQIVGRYFLFKLNRNMADLVGIISIRLAPSEKFMFSWHFLSIRISETKHLGVSEWHVSSCCHQSSSEHSNLSPGHFQARVWVCKYRIERARSWVWVFKYRIERARSWLLTYTRNLKLDFRLCTDSNSTDLTP